MVSKAIGKDPTEAMLHTQKELFDAYEAASHLWLIRVKSEVDLWSELATRLATTRSAPEAIGACQEWWRSGCEWLRKTDNGSLMSGKRSRA